MRSSIQWFHFIYFCAKQRLHIIYNTIIWNSMTKKATMFLLVVAASLAELVQRWDYSVLPSEMWILVEWQPFFHHAISMTKKEQLLKTREILNLMTKESIMHKFEFAVSSAGLLWRWDYSDLPSDVNVDGMATILPCQFIHEKEERTFLRKPR